MEGHEYFSLRRSVEQIQNRNSLEHLLGMHALIIIDYKRRRGEWSNQFVNNLLENIGNAIALLVNNLCSKCEYKMAMKEVCDTFASLQIEQVTNEIKFNKLLSLSTCNRRSVAETLRKFDLYRRLLGRLLEEEPESYNFYQCAIGCLLSAKGLGFWLDETL